MHLRESSQELFSEDEGYAGKRMSLADTQHQSPDVGASWRPLWEVDRVLEAWITQNPIPIKSVDPKTFVINGVNFL